MTEAGNNSMDRILAKNCDFVLSQLAQYNVAIRHSDTTLRGAMSINDWMKAVDAIKKRTNYVDSYRGDEYKIILTASGKEFLKEGGSFVKQLEEAKAEKEKEKERQAEIDYKRRLDISYTEWQKKTYWYFFAIAIIGVIGTVILTIDKMTTKPKIEKVYIPVYSRAKTTSP
jgi:hypothetical protein